MWPRNCHKFHSATKFTIRDIRFTLDSDLMPYIVPKPNNMKWDEVGTLNFRGDQLIRECKMRQRESHTLGPTLALVAIALPRITYTVSTAPQLGSIPDAVGDFFSGRNGNTTARERG